MKHGFTWTLAGPLLFALLLTASFPIDPAYAQELDAGVVKLVVTKHEGGGRVGSGFIVRVDSDWAYVVTAAHVVQGSRKTGVVFSSRRLAEPAPASVIHQQHWDGRGLALLQVSAKAARSAGARALTLSTSGLPRKGQDVFVLGHPWTGGDWSWLRGTVSSRRGETLKVQANVDEGSSGGPVLREGQTVGIVVAEQAGLAIVKSVVNIRNYLDGHGLTALPVAESSPRVEPAPEPARLTVRSNVRGDTVYIDGERRGSTRLDLELAPGPHSVRVEKDGYEAFDTEVELRPGASRTVRATLERAAARPGDTFRDTSRDGSPGPEMVVIPAGSFRMGSPEDEKGRQGDERPVHTVRFAKSFALGRREVTVEEFRAFVEGTKYRTEAEKGDGCYVWDGSDWTKDTKRTWRSPVFEQGEEHPVVCVSWNDAWAYVDWLGKETGMTTGWRLTAGPWTPTPPSGRKSGSSTTQT